jgi:outer membrane cobalamin receptor
MEVNMRTSPGGGFRRLLVPFLSSLVLVGLVVPAMADTLQGRVVDPSGRPVVSADVVVLRQQTVVASVRTDAEGIFGPVSLPPGRYELTVAARDLQLAPTAITITAGESVSCDLRMTLAARQESVLVSAAQVETTVSRSGSSTTVVTAPELRQVQARVLTDVLQLVPGFTTALSGTLGAQTSLFPRGGESDYTLILVDGVPQNAFGGSYDAAHLALANAERVEIVRGPQSALYGSGAIGGIMHVVTAAGGRPEAAFTLEGGGYGQRASNLSARTSAGAWRFGGGFDWLESHGDTRRFDSTGGPVANDDYQRLSATGSIGWSDRPSRRVRVDIRGGRYERGYPGAYGSDPEGLFGGLDTISRGSNDHFSVGTSAVFGSGTGVTHRMQSTWSTTTGTFVSQWTPDAPSHDSNDRLTTRYQIDLNTPGAGTSIGVEWLREQASSTFVLDETGLEAPVRRTDVGMFAETRPSVGARVFPTLGLRVERLDRAALAPGAFRPRLDSSSVWSVNPKIALAWQAREGTSTLGDTRVRASAGTGIKPPTAYDIAFTDNPALKPERSRSVEAGIEQALLTSRLVIDAAWFYNSYDDLIVSVPQPASSVSRYQTDNIANARSSGLEFSAALRPSAALATRLTWTWLETEVLGIDSMPDVAFGPYEVGDALIRRPRHALSLDVRYSTTRWTAFALVGHRGAMRDLEPNWASTVYTNPGRTVTTLGASLRVARGLEAYARMANVFDRRYEDVFGFPAMGRSASVGLRVTAGH